MNFFKKNIKGIFLCLLIAVPSWFLGQRFEVIGGPVIAIILGMCFTLFIKDKTDVDSGIKFVSKKVLQWAVILLGFGLNLSVVAKTGLECMPIICSTIATSLLVAFVFHFILKTPANISTLVGVGSSICGGSAIAATAPVINADDEEVAQAISVIFFFNVLAALIFPTFGKLIGFDQTNGNAFGIFAGTAVNDTSSVTAAASTWDAMFGLEALHQANPDTVTTALDKAVTVKLTRTLAIIPITLVLALIQTVKAKKAAKKAAECAENAEAEETVEQKSSFSFKKVFPFFILYFIAASLITTLCYKFIADPAVLDVVKKVFSFLKTTSKFFIVLAMAAIGLNTNIVKLVKTGGKPLILGALCWISITAVSLLMQHFLGMW